MKRLIVAAALTAFAGLSYAADTLQGTGSSFAYPLYQSWGGEYYRETGGKVNYTPTGSGAGIKAVARREVDFGGSDKPLKPAILKKVGLYQFPTAIGAIAFAYNVPGVRNLKLSEEAIEGIMLGSIRYWDDPILARDNPEARLPHEKVLFVHRSDKSGTTFAFTYYLSKMSKTWRRRIGARKLVDWPVPYRIGGKGNFGVATAIKTNRYSIGYVDFADARKNGLDMAVIQGADGAFVAPEPESFAAAAKYADLNPAKDFYANIGYPPKGYPIVSSTFVLIPKEKKARNRKVVEFFDFGFENGDDNVGELGYVPLPKEVKEKVRGYWREKGLY